MRYADFPALVEVFTNIDADNGLPPFYKRDWNAEVPETWVESFKTAERVLKPLQGKMITHFIDVKQHPTMFESHDNDVLGTALWTIAAPANDEATILLKATGATDDEIDTIEELLNEFFDGELGSLS